MHEPQTQDDVASNGKAIAKETETLLLPSETQSNENATDAQSNEPEAEATQAQDVGDTEAKTQADATQPEESQPNEAEAESQEIQTQSADTGEADVQETASEEVHDVQEAESADTSEETHEPQAQNDVASNGKAIIYAGVILVRNKTPKPISLSPIQLGIYATITIQSGAIVALPHKYARSLIMQQLFEEVTGQLYVVQEKE